ncbi:MAG: hypothetical protein CSB48_06700 [Proteobacteria bacterium]|nr:MAG: hypothetical protein CSB48_06700 [Pseudomonadota bacterium]
MQAVSISPFPNTVTPFTPPARVASPVVDAVNLASAFVPVEQPGEAVSLSHRGSGFSTPSVVYQQALSKQSPGRTTAPLSGTSSQSVPADPGRAERDRSQRLTGQPVSPRPVESGDVSGTLSPDSATGFEVDPLAPDPLAPERQDQSDGPQNQNQNQNQNRKESPANQVNGRSLTPEDIEVIEQLKARDREVRVHEMQHQAVGGQYAGSASFSYQTGPDGSKYAVGGEVPISVSEVSNDPRATIEKMRVVRAAALAPAQPSAQDRAVASRASRIMLNAQRELSAQTGEGLAIQGEQQPQKEERQREGAERSGRQANHHVATHAATRGIQAYETFIRPGRQYEESTTPENNSLDEVV